MAGVILLGFGTSHRRGQQGWTDRARCRAVIDTLRPDLVVDGASPSGGADDIVHEVAKEAGVPTARCPMDEAKDGTHRGRYMNRNARQYREYRPTLGLGLISGRVGSPMSSGSLNMLSICLRGLPGYPPIPVVVYRDNGIEPFADLGVALAQLRRLYAVTRDRSLVVPGRALASYCEVGDPPADEVLAALAYVREGSRWAPWIEAVEATVKA